MFSKKLTLLLVLTLAPSLVHGQVDQITPSPAAEPTPTPKNLEAVIEAVSDRNHSSTTEKVPGNNASTSGSSNMESLWSPGRITQIILGVVESALLTMVLLFPSLMDPVVSFINRYMGSAGTRRRRDVRSALIQHAASIHDLVLDAIDKFEEMDAALSLYF